MEGNDHAEQARELRWSSDLDHRRGRPSATWSPAATARASFLT